MSDGKKEFETLDIIIIVAIFISAMIIVIGTIWWVSNKYKKMDEETISTFSSISENDKYKYQKKGNIITFYEGTTEKASYECEDVNCYIPDTPSDKFTINTVQNFVSIKDGDKYLVFNIPNDSIYYIFDSYTVATENPEYGKSIKNGKYGLMDKNLGIALEIEYDDIDSCGDYFITLKENQIEILDGSLNKILSTPIIVENVHDINAIGKNDIIYIYVTTNDKIVHNYIYNKTTNILEQ